MEEHRGRPAGALGAAAAVLLLAAGPVRAQTDYYNTDAGRPVRVEDAYPVERYAFELQLAPVRLERASGGRYSWGLGPELAYGVLPGTQLEIGFPLQLTDTPQGRDRAGLAGIEISALHNLNVETTTWPALAVAADAVLPVGGLAAEQPYLSFTGIGTRTYRWLRLHVNGRYTVGPEHVGEAGPHELSRWFAGVAVDRALPLQAMLVTGSMHVQQPLAPGTQRAWTAEGGVRYQWSPTLALDAGIGRRLTGDERPWSLTLGAAYVFAVRALLPR